MEIYDTCHPVVISRAATLDDRRAKINYVFETGENVLRRAIYHGAGTVNPVLPSDRAITPPSYAIYQYITELQRPLLSHVSLRREENRFQFENFTALSNADRDSESSVPALRQVSFYAFAMGRISIRVPIPGTRTRKKKKQYFARYFSIQVSRGRSAFGIQRSARCNSPSDCIACIRRHRGTCIRGFHAAVYGEGDARCGARLPRNVSLARD